MVFIHQWSLNFLRCLIHIEGKQMFSMIISQKFLKIHTNLDNLMFCSFTASHNIALLAPMWKVSLFLFEIKIGWFEWWLNRWWVWLCSHKFMLRVLPNIFRRISRSKITWGICLTCPLWKISMNLVNFHVIITGVTGACACGLLEDSYLY